MSIGSLAAAQLRMYARDRQSVFFGLFFPMFFMVALGFVADSEPQPVEIAVVDPMPSGPPGALVSALAAHDLIDLTETDKDAARAGLEDGDYALVLFLPERPIVNAPTTDAPTADTPTANAPTANAPTADAPTADAPTTNAPTADAPTTNAPAADAPTADAPAAGPIALSVLVNAADPQRTQQALTILNAVLAAVENDIRQTEPMFRLDVQDVLARNVRYVDFLVPGLLAFMVLQLSIAGSGFNVVEYKRKGILKRLFVTPLRPIAFVASLVAARLVVVLVQISLLLLVAELVFDISFEGSPLLVYLFVIAGSVLFLSLGFALGGIAKTQSAIMALGNLVIFPQIFLASVFFPLESLPEWLRPVAAILPLSFVSDAIRRIANEGAAITGLGIDVLGIAVWTAASLGLAVAFFNWSEAANAPGRRR